MVIIILLIVAVAGISIYDFLIARTWSEIHYSLDTENEAVLARHRRAAAMRKAYIRVLGITVIGLIVFCISAIVATDSFMVGVASEIPHPPDTIQMTLPAPPLEAMKTIPPKYKVEGNAGINQHAQDEQELSKGEKTDQPEENPDAKNPEKSDQASQPQTTRPFKFEDKNVRASDREQIEKAQNQYQEMLERSKQRAAQREQQRLDELRKRQEGNKPKTNPNQQNITSGTASVDWDHNWRKAYKGDDSYLRTPEYRCPNGVAGKVRIKVKVNSNGNVISAEPVGNISSINQCLVDNAVEYAQKSRFELSSKAIDEGVITYTYHP